MKREKRPHKTKGTGCRLKCSSFLHLPSEAYEYLHYSIMMVSNSVSVAEEPREAAEAAPADDSTQHDADDARAAHQDEPSTCSLLIRPFIVTACFIPAAVTVGIFTGDFVSPFLVLVGFGFFLSCMTLSIAGSTEISHVRGAYHPVCHRVHLTKQEMKEMLVPIHEEQEGCCEICLIDWDDSNHNVVGSPNPECTHVFHEECIIEWLEHSSTCPCCRAEYLPTDDDEEQGNGRGHSNDDTSSSVDEEQGTSRQEEGLSTEREH